MDLKLYKYVPGCKVKSISKIWFHSGHEGTIELALSGLKN